MDKEINMLEIARLLLRRWWIIALTAIFFATVTYIYSSFFIVKMYSSTGSLYVETTRGSDKPLDLSSVTLSKQLVNSYKEILSSYTFADLIGAKLSANGFTYSPAAIRNALSINPVEDTEILKLTVTWSNATDAQTILQSVLDNAPEGIQQVVKSGVVSKIDNASFTRSHISPRIPTNTVMGGMVGAVAAALVIVLLSYTDRKIKHEDDLSKKYDLPVLGIIPDLEEK